jgi:hypothetical protein
VRACARVCMCMCVRACVCVCVLVCVCECCVLCVRARACSFVCARLYARVRLCVHVRLFMRACTLALRDIGRDRHAGSGREGQNQCLLRKRGRESHSESSAIGGIWVDLGGDGCCARVHLEEGGRGGRIGS